MTIGRKSDRVTNEREVIIMFWIVDRIEGDYATIESSSGTFNLELKYLPDDIKEGDTISVIRDARENEERADRIFEKMSKLFKD